jgi:hypothetical protein
MFLAALLAQTPDFSPSPSGLPGAAALGNLVQGLSWVGLLACGAGIVIGAGMWGVGASSNPYQVMNGKRTIILSALGAAIIGMSTFLVRWAFGLGAAAH